MYNYFFGFLYKYYDNTPKGDKSKAPFLSAILVISVLLGLNFLTLRDVYLFQIKGISVSLLNYKTTIVLSLLILFNYIYFRSKYKRILKDYDGRNKVKKVLSLLYIIITVSLAVITAYSVRYNLPWWR